MNENNPETDDIELHKAVELGQALQRLETNPDFDLVIKQAYVVQVLLNKSQNMLDIQPPVRQEALEEIQSVNYLRRHFTDIQYSAEVAAEDLRNG